MSASDAKVPFIERREQDGVEVDRSHAAVRFFQPDPLIDERVGDVERMLLEAERPSIAHALDHEVAGYSCVGGP